VPKKKTEEEIDERLVARDFVMARLGAALAAMDVARESVNAALLTFIDPEDDPRGKDRQELVDTALEAAGTATRCLESAAENFRDADMKAGEPWDEVDDGDDDETDKKGG